MVTDREVVRRGRREDMLAVCNSAEGAWIMGPEEAVGWKKIEEMIQ